jgi:transposase
MTSTPEIDLVNRRLRLSDADHPYIPLLLTVPGVGWVLAFTIGAEIGDIHRFASPKKLCGYTGLCPRVNQSGDKDRRGPLTKQGPRRQGRPDRRRPPAHRGRLAHAVAQPALRSGRRHSSSGRLTALLDVRYRSETLPCRLVLPPRRP